MLESTLLVLTCLVAPHVKALFQGYDVTIFAYGVTGTGKTHTMRGGLKLADRGVIPRLLSNVFRRGKKIVKDTAGATDVQVALSYYEIYNDKVFDLLEPPEKRTATGLPLRAEANGKTVVAGLSERPCEDLRDFEKLYIEANNNRVTASTKLNAHSSRSHAVLRVKLTQTTGDLVRESTASAIDLAGSEDNRRTENGKERLVESAAINKSLFVLSQCIDAISRGDKRIPYRESKMTRILSLGQNNGITVMILNLAPMRSYHLDTLSSLNVSSRAKRIEVREIENEVVFKQVAKATQGGGTTSIARRALRPLANNPNAHNVSSGNAAAKAAETTRPVKAFAVFTDEPKATLATRPIASTTQVRRSSSHRTSTHKRASENENAPRPSKIAKPTAISPPKPKSKSVTVSTAQIEAMVEKKVSEILAARDAAEKQAPEPPQQQPQCDNMSKTMQKRLEALERRIESDDWRDDAKADGLRLLLAAKQHKERGDDAAALEAYESALPYFPGQAKLLSKIERLRAKLDGKVVETGTPRSARKRRARKVVTEEEDVSYTEGEADVEEGSFLRPSSRRPRSKIVVTTMLADENGPPSPQAQQLLDIVNSRDILQIRGLVGFGAKKAKDLVDYMELIGADDGGRIESLSQLRTIPGLGGRAIERAYGGLVA